MAAPAYEPEFVCDSTDRPLWLVKRREGVGSSDAPATLGISPFSNPFRLSLVKSGLIEDDEETELMRWGRYVEAPMLRAFLDETGLKGELMPQLFRSREPNHEYMMATPDAWIQDGDEIGGAECKLKLYQADEWEKGGFPDYVITQAQHAMRVMGWRFMFILALLDGYRMRWQRIERNDDVMGSVVIPAERRWWDTFQAGGAFDPTIGKQSATDWALKRLYPEDSGETIRLKGTEMLNHWAAYLDAKKQEKAWKETALRHSNALKASIGAATFAVLDDGTQLSLKTTRVSAHEVAGHSYRSIRKVGK